MLTFSLQDIIRLVSTLFVKFWRKVSLLKLSCHCWNSSGSISLVFVADKLHFIDLGEKSSLRLTHCSYYN